MDELSGQEEMEKFQRTNGKEEGRKIKTWIIKIAFLLFLTSCVKTIYVGDEQALRYKFLYEECHKDEVACQIDLDTCIKVCDEIQLTDPN